MNAGRPLLLEGGLDWKAMGLSPRDMDFLEARNGAARDIALALGVPPMLIGIPGDNTYANYRGGKPRFIGSPCCRSSTARRHGSAAGYRRFSAPGCGWNRILTGSPVLPVSGTLCGQGSAQRRF